MSVSASQPESRRNVGRIDHIILLYRNRDNQEAARRNFSATLGIDDWQVAGEGSEGIYIIISWKSGIELICPTREVAAFERHLEAHGEGFYCMVFGVADLTQAMAHIKQLSGRSPYPLGDPPPPVYEKFDIAREAIVGELGGIRVMLGEFKPKG
jgi:4-hydroxyphenylpyruvate dioxygenase-like putative hemolysin